MKHAAKNLLLALVNGFILFFFSERLFWSVWRPGDSIPDLMVTWLAYSTLAYALGLTVLLAIAWWLNFRADVMRFQPGWAGTIFSLLILGAFYVQHIRRLGWLPFVVLPTVLSVALVPLWVHRQRHARVTEVRANRWVRGNLAHLGLMPIAATVVYAAAKPVGLDHVSIASIVYYWITGPAGFAMLVIAVYQCGLRRRAGQSGLRKSATGPRGVG